MLGRRRAAAGDVAGAPARCVVVVACCASEEVPGVEERDLSWGGGRVAPCRRGDAREEGVVALGGGAEAVGVIGREGPRVHVVGDDEAGGDVAAAALFGHGGGRGLAEVGFHAVADVADEVFVAAPVAEGGGAAGVDGGGAVEGGGGDGIVFEFALLEAAVADEGAQDQGVGGGCGEEELDRGEEGAGLLAALGADDLRDAVDGDSDHNKTETEEEDQLNLALGRHLAAEDDRDGDEDEEQVRDDVADGHGEELRVPLAALAAGVGEDLPVVGEGLALGEVADDDGDEGSDEGGADDEQGDVVRPLPGDVETYKELEDGALENPKPGFGTVSVWVLPRPRREFATYVAA